MAGIVHLYHSTRTRTSLQQFHKLSTSTEAMVRSLSGYASALSSDVSIEEHSYSNRFPLHTFKKPLVT